MVIEDMPRVIEQTEDGGIAYGVKDVLAFLAAGHDVAFAEHCQLLRQRALLDLEPRAELIDPNFSAPKLVQDPDPDRMGESPEELRRELGQLWHMQIFKYAHIIMLID